MEKDSFFVKKEKKQIECKNLRAIQKRIILYAINRIFNTTKGIEKIHIEDIIKLCNNNVGNKFLTPNKNITVNLTVKDENQLKISL